MADGCEQTRRRPEFAFCHRRVINFLICMNCHHDISPTISLQPPFRDTEESQAVTFIIDIVSFAKTNTVFHAITQNLTRYLSLFSFPIFLAAA